MREANLRVLAVLDDGTFLGVALRERMLATAMDAPVQEAVTKLVAEMPASTPVRLAAKLFVQQDLDIVPVFDDREFVGLLTSNQLLTELGRSWDPMTGLSWSDRLREWGVEALQNGHEVTLVFIDLDGFGAYNKRHGHIVGDRVLKSASKLVADECDQTRDLLVRYGGDEFVVGSVRPRVEVLELVTRLRSVSLSVEGVPEEVTFSVGMSGGKRTNERQRAHFVSMLDNLINLASRDCLANKAEKKRESTETAHQSRCHLEVEQASDKVAAIASVVLAGRSAMGYATAASGSALDAVSRAVLAACQKLVPSATEIKDIVIYRRWDGNPVGIVLAELNVSGSKVEIRTTGWSAKGVFSAVADAVVEAAIKANRLAAEAQA